MIKFKRFLKGLNKLLSGSILNVICFIPALVICLIMRSYNLSLKIEQLLKKTI